MNEHILFSYKFDRKGTAEAVTAENIAKHLKSRDLAWVHLDALHPSTQGWLKENASYLDQFIINALTEEETRPRMMQINDGVLILLRGVNLNKDSSPEDMVSIRLWVDKYRIISIRKRRLKAVLDLEKKIRSNKAPHSSGDFLCMLISKLFERMDPIFTDLDESTDQVEEMILDTPTGVLREKIVNIRKQAIMFRRYMAPQKDAISQLQSADIKWLSDKNIRVLQENYNRITRYLEDLDAIRERAQIVKDELSNILSDKLNKNMYILSLIAAIFLPLGFLTGLLGVNVGGIPGSANENAFMIFNGILLGIFVIQMIIFKIIKWI